LSVTILIVYLLQPQKNKFKCSHIFLKPFGFVAPVFFWLLNDNSDSPFIIFRYIKLWSLYVISNILIVIPSEYKGVSNKGITILYAYTICTFKIFLWSVDIKSIFKVYIFILVKYTNEQRWEIIKNYCRNTESVVATLRALTPVYGRNNLPARQTVRAIVNKFESTYLLLDVLVTVRQRVGRSTENITAVIQSVTWLYYFNYFLHIFLYN